MLLVHALSLILISGCAAHTRSASSPLPSQADSFASRPAFAEKIKISGVGDVGKITDHLFRGSQPSEKGFEELRKFGITTIVDLRGERHGRVQSEKKRVQALGMTFVNIHASGWSPPTDEQLAQFFVLTEKRPSENIFFHCWLGDDRTGVFLAAYRIAFQHWTADNALAEMYYFHFKGFWHPAMRKYVRNFPQHFAEAPAFAPFRKNSPQSNRHQSKNSALTPLLSSRYTPPPQLSFETTLR